MSISIGSCITVENLNKIDIMGGQAPELDCYEFRLSWSTYINISAIKCKILKIYTCKDVAICGSVIDEIEIKDSDVLLVGCNINTLPKIFNSKVDYRMCYFKK